MERYFGPGIKANLLNFCGSGDLVQCCPLMKSDDGAGQDGSNLVAALGGGEGIRFRVSAQ